MNPIQAIQNHVEEYSKRLEQELDEEVDAVLKATGVMSGYTVDQRLVYAKDAASIDIKMRVQGLFIFVMSISTALCTTVLFIPVTLIVVLTPLIKIQDISSMASTAWFLVKFSAAGMCVSVLLLFNPTLFVDSKERMLFLACRDGDLNVLKKLENDESGNDKLFEMKLPVAREALNNSNPEVFNSYLKLVNTSLSHNHNQTDLAKLAIELGQYEKTMQILSLPSRTIDCYLGSLFEKALESNNSKLALDVYKKFSHNSYYSEREKCFNTALNKGEIELCKKLISCDNLNSKSVEFTDRFKAAEKHGSQVLLKVLVDRIDAQHINSITREMVQKEYVLILNMINPEKLNKDLYYDPSAKIIDGVVQLAMKKNDVKLFKKWFPYSNNKKSFVEHISKGTASQIMQLFLNDKEIADANVDKWVSKDFALENAEDQKVAELLKTIVNHPNASEKNSVLFEMARNVFSTTSPLWSIQQGVAEAKNMNEQLVLFSNLPPSEKLLAACQLKNIYTFKRLLEIYDFYHKDLHAALTLAQREGFEEAADLLEEKITGKSFYERWLC